MLLSVQAFTQVIAGNVVLHLSDCACVVKALQEDGSATSVHLYHWAVEIWKWCAQHDIILLSEWVSGVEVVRVGADRLSREAAVDTHNYTSDPSMKTAVAEVCRQDGCALTIDLFATAVNKQLSHYCTRFYDVGSEVVDAFTKPS